MVFEIFSDAVYGDVYRAVAILIVTLIAARIFYPIFKRTVHHLTKKTETTLDDELVRALEKPLYLGILIAGTYYALRGVDYLAPYFDILKRGFTVAGILLGGYTAYKLFNIALVWYKEGIAKRTHTRIDDNLIPVFKKIFKLLVIAGIAILVLNEFGFRVEPLLAGLGIGGLAIALALQPTLSNFFAGTYLASEGAIKVGDFVEIDDKVKGYIREIGSRSTKIETLQNNLIIIPNSKLSDSTVMNYSEPVTEIAVLVPVGISYETDLDKAEKVCIEVAKKLVNESEGGLKDFEPMVRYDKFGDSNIDFYVVFKIKDYSYLREMKHEFIKQLKKRFDKEGIVINYPVRTIYMHEAKKK